MSLFCPHTHDFSSHILGALAYAYIHSCIPVFLYILVPEHRAHLEPKGAYIEDRILQRRERRLASPGKLHSTAHLAYQVS